MKKNDDIHPSMRVLYQLAEERGVKGKSAVAKTLNEIPQTVNNWEKRGISDVGKMKAGTTFNFDPRLLNGLVEGDIENKQFDEIKVSENNTEYTRHGHENWLEEIEAIFDAVSETDKAEILNYARYRYDVSSNYKKNKKGHKILHGLIVLPEVRTYSYEQQDKSSKKENT